MISVTVPIYNEIDSVLPLHQRVCEVMGALGRPWELLFVNDGSTDGSAGVLDLLAQTHPNVKVLHLRRNFGQTAAMMAGIDYASGDIIVPMDGDLQNDPADIPRLLAKLDEGYDVVSGWRRDRKDDPLTRNLPSWVANRLVSLISGVHLHDYGCTLKAYHREVIKDVKLYGEMHRFIPIYASWHGARVAEVPVRHHARRFGHSKYGLERTVKLLLDLVVVKFLATFAQKPMYIFGGIGLLSFAVSLGSGLWALWLKLAEGVSFVQTPLPLLTVMTSITGAMCVLMGLLAEMLIRTYHESQDKAIYEVGAARNFEARNVVALAHGSSVPARPAAAGKLPTPLEP